MRNLEIKITIDMDSPQEMNAAVAVLQSIQGKIVGRVPSDHIKAEGVDFEDVSEQVKKKPEPKKEVAKTAPAAKAEAPKKEEAAQETESDDLTGDGEGREITTDMIREMLTKKVKAHREAMKAKLAELGAPNVVKLAPENYEEFYSFMEGLE